MSDHTPTPWRVFTTRDGLKLVGIGGRDGGGILDAGFGVWSWKDAEGIANAELVVRAVNSLQRLIDTLEDARAFVDPDSSRPPFGNREMMRRIDAAIASAVPSPVIKSAE